jgi:hypothetical protein
LIFNETSELSSINELGLEYRAKITIAESEVGRETIVS